MTQKLKNQLQAKTEQENKPRTMLQMIQVMKPQIANALPSMITPERFTRMCMTAVSSTPTLAKCTFESFCGAMLQSASLGLEPNTPLGQAYLIPYWNSKKRGYECQFQIGYRGMLSLSYRGGATQITAHEVCENDEFHYEYGLRPMLKHIPAIKDRGDVIAYYATYTLQSGGYGFAVMSKEDVEQHANRYSAAKKQGFSPWQTNFDEMAKKTVIKKALKYAPMSAEVQKAFIADESVKDWNDKMKADDILNTQGEYIDTETEPEIEEVDVETKTDTVAPDAFDADEIPEG